MREEYDIEKLNPRRNPYAKKEKQQVTVNNPPLKPITGFEAGA